MYAFELCDHVGQTIADANVALQRTMTFTRNQPAEVQIELDLESDAANVLAAAAMNGIPRLRVWEDDDLRFYGKWFPMQEQATADSASMTAIFRSPDAVLEHRFTATLVSFAAQDAGQIAWSLISTANALSPTGVIQGIIATTVARDRTFEHKQLLEAISELTTVDQGFDYEVAPFYSTAQPTALGKFNVFASQGSDRSSDTVFEYGDKTLSNVLSVERSWALPVNKVTVLGADGLIGTADDAASITTFGMYEDQEDATDVVEQATVDAKAQALLRPMPVRVLSFQPDPGLSLRPWTEFWLGDLVAIHARYGSIVSEDEVRINQVAISLDSDDAETITVAIERAA